MAQADVGCVLILALLNMRPTMFQDRHPESE